MNRHKIWMQRALALARQAEGCTSPNPAVGAVVVNDGQIVGEGYHRGAGMPHAEAEALRSAGKLARNATLYVTLEPCNHHGRTPPCTEAIIQAGISKVFYAVGDPNPQVSGQGHRRLAEAGIVLHAGLCTQEARDLNRFYLYAVCARRPYVLAKFAASLDGKIATHTGQSRWITGSAAREKGHVLRHIVDAILIGAGTAIADNPRLTTRLSQPNVRHPLRIVLDSRGRVPRETHLFQPDLPGQTLVATTAAMPCSHRRLLTQQGIEVLVLPASAKGEVDLRALLDVLGQRQLASLLVEGGARVLGSFFEAKLVNEVWAFLAPLIIGGQHAPGAVGGAGFSELHKACRLHHAHLERIGDDFVIQSFVNEMPGELE